MKIRILATLAACMAAGPLHAQGAQRIASFLYVPRADSATSRDARWTILYATQRRGRPEGGSITWGWRASGAGPWRPSSTSPSTSPRASDMTP